MRAERERPICSSALKTVFVTPALRSPPARPIFCPLRSHALTRNLDASLLAEHLTVDVRLRGAGKIRVAIDAVAVRGSDALVAARPDAQGGRVAGRHVESLGQRDRTHIRRMDDHMHALASGCGATHVV